jgi:hypothetical protein
MCFFFFLGLHFLVLAWTWLIFWSCPWPTNVIYILGPELLIIGAFFALPLGALQQIYTYEWSRKHRDLTNLARVAADNNSGLNNENASQLCWQTEGSSSCCAVADAQSCTQSCAAEEEPPTAALVHGRQPEVVDSTNAQQAADERELADMYEDI